MRSINEVIQGAEYGTVIDLEGENVLGMGVDSKINNPAGITIKNGLILGPTMWINPVDVNFENMVFDCRLEFGPLKGNLIMLGGRDWTIVDCLFVGGKAAGQLSVGKNERFADSRMVPYGYLVKNCTFRDHGGLWGRYPQAHNLYCYSDPRWDQNGVFDHCNFEMSYWGAGVKIGGTGNWPLAEGSRGVTLVDCTFSSDQAPAEVDGAMRSQGFLAQGAKTRCRLVRPVFRSLHGEPWITIADGAYVEIVGEDLSQGLIQDVRWYAYGGLQMLRDKREAKRNVGGLRWLSS